VKIYNSVEEFSPDFKVVLTLGTFDGVHIGHQSIIHQLNKYAEKIGGESVLLSFYPHPQHVLFPEDQQLKLLNTIDERMKMLANYGLKHFIIQEFTPKFSRIKSVNFVRDVLVNQLKVSQLIIGYDHHFGRNREGTYQELVDLSSLYDYEITKIDPQKYKDVSVSSTKLRKLIVDGNIKVANQYLGHPFSFLGKVVKGKSVGKKIGFPTANLQIDNKWKLHPSVGVYAVKLNIKGDNYFGMMNVGVNPTFNGENVEIEVHIFDFNKDIYDSELEVFIIEKIRNEIKFNSQNELISQLKEDENLVRNIYKI